METISTIISIVTGFTFTVIVGYMVISLFTASNKYLYTTDELLSRDNIKLNIAPLCITLGIYFITLTSSYSLYVSNNINKIEFIIGIKLIILFTFITLFDEVYLKNNLNKRK